MKRDALAHGRSEWRKSRDVKRGGASEQFLWRGGGFLEKTLPVSDWKRGAFSRKVKKRGGLVSVSKAEGKK